MSRPNDTSRQMVLPLGNDEALRRRFMVVDAPLQGNLRFGRLLEVLDKLAEETALQYVRAVHPKARVVTAAIDTIMVRHAADVTRDMTLHARINFVGRSSLEVGIRIEQTGTVSTHIASCYFTMVARSTEGEGSLVLPPLEYLDELEVRRMHKAVAARESYRQQQASSTEPPSREEYALLLSLHQSQEQADFRGLLVGKLVTESWERMYPEQENVPRTIFGGYLVRRAYELSSICAEQVAPDRPVIVAVNRINFFNPVRLDDKLRFTSRVVFTGETSIIVEAGIERISRDRKTKALTNSCLFTFANVDGNLNTRPVPPVFPTTYAEDARYLDAYRQHQEYLQRKQAGKPREKFRSPPGR